MLSTGLEKNVILVIQAQGNKLLLSVLMPHVPKRLKKTSFKCHVQWEDDSL